MPRAQLTTWARTVAHERQFEAIRAYAALGWPICAAAYFTGDGCSCARSGCCAPGAHPLSVPSGGMRGTREIEAIIGNDVQMNLMVAAGRVVDAVEVAIPLGRFAVARMERNGPVALAGNSYLFFVAAGPPLLAQGVSWFGAGAHVLVPPSALPSGHTVQWIYGPGRALPDLAALARALGDGL